MSFCASFQYFPVYKSLKVNRFETKFIDFVVKRRIVVWDELSFGTNCRLGRIVAWDELSLGTNCRLGRIVAWDELSLGTNCRLGRIVARDELSLGTNCRLGRIVAWEELSLGTNCRLGRIVTWDESSFFGICDELSPNQFLLLSDYEVAVAMGFGMTNLDHRVPPSMLMETQLHYTNCVVYFSAYGKKIDVEKQICYQSKSIDRPAATCFGDFGGPLVHRRLSSSKGEFCLIGVASSSYPSCRDGKIHYSSKK